MKEKNILLWLIFCSLFGAWKLVGIFSTQLNANNLPSTEQAAKTQPKQDKSFFHFPSFLTVYLLLSVVLWLHKGDCPENVHTVSVLK